MAATAPAPDKIYQASDLNQGYRVILDAARHGAKPRVRDKDGTSVVLVLEHEHCSLELLSNATACYLILEHAVSHREAHDLSLAEFGDWTWLRVFDHDDLEAFLAEVRDALVVATREHSFEPVRTVLQDWRVTAQTLDDPERRAILLGGLADDDFVDASPPVVATA
jgi:hypothetical protein